ncbi:hypothetical protein FN846DRAFT_890267 [Sphaerosporella brunnea]|uniref:Uncharacterized protein n=1 Tax=Sphaerosporella brunnea TaxID=1250544 RepID=A0A5J5EX62_9PEZI|nr:hypothetical protein FN846DRAFT_890267 [Sphaerosporella brunnea]
MPDTRARTTKRARSTQDAELTKKTRVVQLPLYKDHDWMCEQLGIPPRDKLASLIIRREVQDLCEQHGFKMTRKYSSWGAKEMRKLVKTVTAQLNADPKRKKVISTTAVDALVHRLCLDNVRNMRVAQERKSKGDSHNEGEDRNSKDEEDDHTSSDEDTPAAPTEPPYAKPQALETDMNNQDDDKELPHFAGGKWSVNESHTEIDEQLSNQVTDTQDGDLNGPARLAEMHHREIRLPKPPAQQQAVETDMDHEDGQDDKEFGHFGSAIDTEINEQLSNQVSDRPNGDLHGQTGLAEAHHHEIRLPPGRSVRAKCDDETRSMDNGRESRSCELNPGPKPLSAAATVPEDTVHILLPQASQCDTRTSVLVHYGNESPSNPPVVIPIAKPWHMLYLLATRRVPCNFNHVRLGAIVPESTEMVYLDTEQAWARLTARREVVRLILVLIPRSEDISLPQVSQCDTRTSILVHIGNESPSNPPVVIPRAQPFINLYLWVSERVPCNDDEFRLGGIVPETSEIVYLDTEQAWVRLTARSEVVRLILLLMPHTE